MHQQRHACELTAQCRRRPERRVSLDRQRGRILVHSLAARAAARRTRVHRDVRGVERPWRDRRRVGAQHAVQPEGEHRQRPVRLVASLAAYVLAPEVVAPQRAQRLGGVADVAVVRDGEVVIKRKARWQRVPVAGDCGRRGQRRADRRRHARRRSRLQHRRTPGRTRKQACRHMSAARHVSKRDAPHSCS